MRLRHNRFAPGLFLFASVEPIGVAASTLTEGTIIVVRDMLPVAGYQERVPIKSKVWNSDYWRALLRARANWGIETCIVDIVWGCGLIRPADQPLFSPEQELAFENSQRCKHEWLNKISVLEFESRYLF